MLDEQSLTDILMCVAAGELDHPEAHKMICEQIATRDKAIDLIAGTLREMNDRLQVLEERVRPTQKHIPSRLIVQRMEEAGEDWETARQNLLEENDE